MSSRILRGAEAAGVQPIRWRQVGEPGENAMAPSSDNPSSRALAGQTAALEQEIASLRTEIISREEQAREAGFREGERQARDRLEAPLREAAASLARGVTELVGYRRRLRQEAEEDLVRLAVATARKVLRRELSTDPSALLGVLKAALEKLAAREVLQIRVSPADTELISEAVRARGAPEAIEVVGDPSLERGGLVVETVRGQLDASVETQLAEIERGLVDLVRRSGQ